jgi:hypothetical protein
LQGLAARYYNHTIETNNTEQDEMSLKALAVETSRYHSRMAVRATRYFHDAASAERHRADRDEWLQIARKA